MGFSSKVRTGTSGKKFPAGTRKGTKMAHKGGTYKGTGKKMKGKGAMMKRMKSKMGTKAYNKKYKK